jgi:hypothetical protein
MLAWGNYKAETELDMPEDLQQGLLCLQSAKLSLCGPVTFRKSHQMIQREELHHIIPFQSSMQVGKNYGLDAKCPLKAHVQCQVPNHAIGRSIMGGP